MTEQLVVRLGTTANEPIDWVVIDADQAIIASGQLANASQLASLQARAGERPLLALVPSHAIHLAEVPVPEAAKRKTKQLVPFQLEEELLGELDSQFFAYHQRRAGHQQVAVVSHTLMQQWLAWLHDAQLTCQQLIPDVLALPLLDELSAVLPMGQQLLVRHGEWAGCTGEASWLSAILGHYQAYAEVPSELPPPQQQDDQYLPMQLLAIGAQQCPFNLLQGEYQVRQQHAIDLGPWRAVAIAAGVCAVLWMSQQFFLISQAQQQANAFATAIQRDVKQHFPELGTYRDLRRKLSQHIKQAAQTEQGIPAMQLLANLAPAFSQSGVQTKLLRYDQGRSEWRLQIAAKDFSQFQTFSNIAREAGFEVQQGTINNRDNQVIAAVTIKG